MFVPQLVYDAVFVRGFSRSMDDGTFFVAGAIVEDRHVFLVVLIYEAETTKLVLGDAHDLFQAGLAFQCFQNPVLFECDHFLFFSRGYQVEF